MFILTIIVERESWKTQAQVSSYNADLVDFGKFCCEIDLAVVNQLYGQYVAKFNARGILICFRVRHLQLIKIGH